MEASSNATNVKKQALMDYVMVQTYKKEKAECGSNGTPSSSYVMYLRAKELRDKVYGVFEELLTMPSTITFQELERIIPNPATCECPDFPFHIFTPADKLRLLQEDYALYGEPGDKDSLESQLEGAIHRGFECLSSVEKDILIYSIDEGGYKEGKPWYERELLQDIFLIADYDALLEKMNEYAVEGLWYCGHKLTSEDLQDIEKGGFSDIAGMDELKEQLLYDFIKVMKEPMRAKKLGLSLPNGMLLYGPPGCGKTAFANKFAEEAGCSFRLVNCSDIASTFLHGTQQKIAKVFEEAEEKKPCILFFDEIEAMIPKRGATGNEYSQTETNEFLTQLNHCGRRGIFVIGATNRPQDIDEAALRSGRLDMKVYFPTPDEETRASLFIHYLKDKNIRGKIDIDTLVEKTDGYISADIKKIVELSARRAFRKDLDYVSMEMLEETIKSFKPTVSKSSLREHENIRDKFEGKKTEYQRIGFC